MNCSICEQHGITSVALWQVGKAGYCRAHKDEAWAHEATKRKNNPAFNGKNAYAYQTIDYLEIKGGGSGRIINSTE